MSGEDRFYYPCFTVEETEAWGVGRCPESQGCHVTEPGSGFQSSDLSRLRWHLCTRRAQTLLASHSWFIVIVGDIGPSHSVCVSVISQVLLLTHLHLNPGVRVRWERTQMYIFHNRTKCRWARCAVNSDCLFQVLFTYLTSGSSAAHVVQNKFRAFAFALGGERMK